MQAQRVLDCQNEHGEGIFWNAKEGCIWWTDIQGMRLYSYNPATQNTNIYEMSERVCCFAPCKSGGLIVAFANRVSLYDLDTKVETKICDFEPNNPETRLNDGRTDRQGRFIVGGMNEISGKADSSVLRIDPDLSVTTLIENISCANSTCFSPDGKTMYFANTPDREILSYEYDTATGVVSNKQTFASFLTEPGLPDGSCVDAQGGVWNAEWEGGRVVRVAPNGKIDHVIELPVSKPTCCAFGGATLDTLYITTSRLMHGEADLAREPDSGGLFAVKPGICGIQDVVFNY